MNVSWNSIEGYSDITYAKKDGVARIAFNRPEVRNAFRPKTVAELLRAFYDAQEDNS
ncbi:MAG: enoyl-CoA hydratase-related protein, partial [Bacteroidota bacterium]|nr:enoyl-CoA hydratase-related protein [Bacteroidota bacterium]